MIGKSVNFDLKLIKCASEDVIKKLASKPKTKPSFPFLDNFTKICSANTLPDEQQVIFMSNGETERVVFDSGKVEDRTNDTPPISNSFSISFEFKNFFKNFKELRNLVKNK